MPNFVAKNLRYNGVNDFFVVRVSLEVKPSLIVKTRPEI